MTMPTPLSALSAMTVSAGLRRMSALRTSVCRLCGIRNMSSKPRKMGSGVETVTWCLKIPNIFFGRSYFGMP